MLRSTLAALALGLSCSGVLAQPATFQTRNLTPESALKVAQAAMAHCRANNAQIAVAVVDRSGLLQVLLRDRFAGAHTVEMATNKAWTAASFRGATHDIAVDTQAGRPMSGIRQLPRVIAAAGGKVIEGGGTTFGGVGVSGAPGGEVDDACAEAGIKALGDALEF